jgi:hypothetical protein
VSQLKEFISDYSRVAISLPVIPALDVKDILPEKILDRRLVKKGNVAVTQVLVLWTGLLDAAATWEDYEVLRHWFPSAPAWVGCVFRGGNVITT